MILLLFDLMSIPVQVAWEMELVGFALGSYIIAIIYWFVDILRRFNMGFYDEGRLVLERHRISARYLKRAFWLDSGLVCIDFVILSLHEGNLRALRSARFFRLLRALRLGRIAKIQQLIISMEDLCGAGASNFAVLVSALLRTILGIFASAHVLCCCWYAVG